MKKKSCPMQTMNAVAPYGGGELRAVTYMGTCVGGECAWWDGRNERCAVLGMAKN